MPKTALSKPRKVSITRSIRWNTETLKSLEQRAKRENRTVNNLVNTLCRQALGL